jgi:osmotically-inducible protein OsmY
LKEAVRRELNWSPFVQEEQVDITVEEGVVTLNGVVLTMNAVVEATEEAYEAGAVHVYNNLDLL